ncbi:MAG: TlpA family protein disulfide reductase [Bryobacter sp.]|jgi:thiol-disulfide isomerase/thioredoxin|nr:TlpA family protein disulfide reductase [Bryobacter sp.]
MRVLAGFVLIVSAAAAAIVSDVRSAAMAGDFARGENLLAEYRQTSGVNGEYVEAYSWMARGALGAKKYDEARRYAAATRELALELLKQRPLDQERHLPIGLGASIEVEAQAQAAAGERAGAVAFLNEELKRWHATSIRTRIQKNINLLSLEGKPAPALEMKEWLGAKPQPIASYRGKPLLLFFWAHWCGDCKAQAPVLERLQKDFPQLAIVGPTQRYGYVARGEEAGPAAEANYIEQVRAASYGTLTMTVPLSEENFKAWGASTTPTLVLVDRQGMVRLYRPGKMTYEELAALVTGL